MWLWLGVYDFFELYLLRGLQRTFKEDEILHVYLECLTFVLAVLLYIYLRCLSFRVRLVIDIRWWMFMRKWSSFFKSVHLGKKKKILTTSLQNINYISAILHISCGLSVQKCCMNRKMPIDLANIEISSFPVLSFRYCLRLCCRVISSTLFAWAVIGSKVHSQGVTLVGVWLSLVQWKLELLPLEIACLI